MRLVSAKNVGVAGDHHPARVDAGAARVGEQRDAASRRRRRRAAVELTFHTTRPSNTSRPRCSGAHEALVVLGREHRLEALEVQRADRHVGEGGHGRRSYAQLTRRDTDPARAGLRDAA